MTYPMKKVLLCFIFLLFTGSCVLTIPIWVYIWRFFFLMSKKWSRKILELCFWDKGHSGKSKFALKGVHKRIFQIYTREKHMLGTWQWSILDQQAQNHLKLSNMTKVRLGPIFNLNVKTCAWHVYDTCRACETLINQFLDLKNPHLESKIIKIRQETPEIWEGH